VPIPLDGDIHFAFYRIDVFEQHNLTPPRTWREYVDAARFLSELDDADRDFNGGGVPDYASCIAKKQMELAFWFPAKKKKKKKNQ
jgi:multiple sugar transport system substrate-binding protein